MVYSVEKLSHRERVRLDEKMVYPANGSEPPLAGCTVLVTRAASEATALVDRIERLGGKVLCFPTIAITDPDSWEPLDQAIAAIQSYRWLVVTSTNGADRFGTRLQAVGTEAGALAHLRIAAVGTGTAQRLDALGFKVDLIPDQYRASALPAAMAPLLRKGDRILMARGDLADPKPAERLRTMGYQVDDLIAYRTVLGEGDPKALDRLRAALGRRVIDYALFASASAVRNLLQLLGGPEALMDVRIAVIGPQTQMAAESAGLQVAVVAEKARLNDLVDAVADDAVHRNCSEGGIL